MRLLVRCGLVCLFFVTFRSWAQQTSQATTNSTSDPQAVAVVQAAITALGGATAINQAQSWTFHAQMEGPAVSSDLTYVISTDTDAGKLAAVDGSTIPARPIHSHFVPALIGRILLQELQDTRFSFLYEGAGTRDSKPVTVIRVMLSDGSLPFPAQAWSFDANNIPIQVDFRLPGEIGAHRSFHGIVRLSNYQTVSGVLYPFSISTFRRGDLPEIITLQSIAVGTTAVGNDFNGRGGDLR